MTLWGILLSLWQGKHVYCSHVKSNFIIFTAQRNISSVHPSQYVIRDEPYFRCDNGFKVVSRNYRGNQLFNFIDISDGFARIVSDIDFIQVKPFSEYKDMTARGYTPDRRCWMIFDDGKREEINESRKINKAKFALPNQT